MKATFILCKDRIEYTKEMTTEDKAQLFDAILYYNNDQPIWEELSYVVKVVFSKMKNFFDEQNHKYEEKVKRNKENGAKGGRPPSKKPKKPTGLKWNPDKPKETLTDTDTDTNKKNIYLEIYNTRNNKNITQHKKLNEEIKKSIEKILQDLSESEVIQAIENYATIYHSDKTYFKHKWTLSEFLSRKNGARVFLYKSEEDYLDKDKKQSKKKENYSTEARDLPT